MDWQAVVTTLGGTVILVAAVAWLAKVLIIALLSKDLERFKSDLKTRSDFAIEDFKSRIELESQKQLIQYSSLHGKRAELVAELYAHLVALYNSIQHVTFELLRRQIREEAPHPEERNQWEMRAGIDTLDELESQTLQEMKRVSRAFFAFYGTNKIYFTEGVCSLIDRFATLSGYLAVNYENVAIKDGTGALRVNPKVKEVWDSALSVIPRLIVDLEREFRSLLGVHPRELISDGGKEAAQ